MELDTEENLLLSSDGEILYYRYASQAAKSVTSVDSWPNAITADWDRRPSMAMAYRD